MNIGGNVRKHYGPGPHPSGSPQAVHAGAKYAKRGETLAGRKVARKKPIRRRRFREKLSPESKRRIKQAKGEIEVARGRIKRLETEAPKTPYKAHMRPVEIKRHRQDIERARRELLNFAPGYETAALVELARRRGATNIKVTVKAGTYRQFEWTGKDGKKRFVGSAIGFAQAMGRDLGRGSKRVKI